MSEKPKSVAFPQVCCLQPLCLSMNSGYISQILRRLTEMHRAGKLRWLFPLFELLG